MLSSVLPLQSKLCLLILEIIVSSTKYTESYLFSENEFLPVYDLYMRNSDVIELSVNHARRLWVHILMLREQQRGSCMQCGNLNILVPRYRSSWQYTRVSVSEQCRSSIIYN